MELDIFKVAAERVSKWPETHGIYGRWIMQPSGLALVADNARKTISRSISWSALDRSNVPDFVLENLEDIVLKEMLAKD